MSFFLLIPLKTMGQSEALIRQLNALATQMQGCGQDIQCIQRLSKEMMAIQKQFQQSGSVLAAKSGYDAMEKPCERFLQQGFGGQNCVPVKVMVKSRNIEQQKGRFFSGVLPDEGKSYIRMYVAFDYEAEGRGLMTYTSDFGEFQLTAFGSRKKTRITRLQGQWKNWDSLNRRMDSKTLDTSNIRVKNPFDMSIVYPHPKVYGPIQTNLNLKSAEVETSDDYLPTCSGTGINPYDTALKPSFVILPKDMAQYVKQGGFEKYFYQRFEQPGGNQWSEHQVTVKVVFGGGCKDPVKLKIVAPDTKEFKYCYSDAKVGVLKMVFRADVTPAKYAKDVVWDIPEIKGSIRKVTPKNLKGPKVTVKYTYLPKKNSEFGPKTVTARVKTKTCSAKADQVIKIFYFRDEKNNPDGNVPNWFYYWKQTPAGRPMGHQADIRYGDTDFFKCAEPGVPGMYNSIILPDSILVCDLTKLGTRMKLTYPKVERTVPVTLKKKHKATTKGIDTFAVTVLHEFQHLRNYHAWKKDLNKPDGDGDGIPDVLEKSMGLDKTKFQTFFGNDPEFKKMGGDEEFLAYEAMFGVTPGNYDSYDWGLPGRNWPVK